MNNFTSGSSNHSWHHILPVGPPPVWTSSEIFALCRDFEEVALIFLERQGPKNIIGIFLDSMSNANLWGRLCLSFCRSLEDPEMGNFNVTLSDSYHLEHHLEPGIGSVVIPSLRLDWLHYYSCHRPTPGISSSLSLLSYPPATILPSVKHAFKVIMHHRYHRLQSSTSSLSPPN